MNYDIAGLYKGINYAPKGSGKFYASKLNDLSAKVELQEADDRNDDYRNKTRYKSENDKYYHTFNLSSLASNKESYLEGKIQSSDDIDYYRLSNIYKSIGSAMGRNIEMSVILEADSDTDNYDLSVYDADGNLVSFGIQDENGVKRANIENWNSSMSNYTIKVTRKDNKEIPQDNYRIKIVEKDVTEEKGIIKSTNGQEYQEKSDLIKNDWYNSFSSEEKYTGNDSVEKLLIKLENGERLSTEEMKYINIFANLKDYQTALAKGQLHTYLQEIKQELEKESIDTDTVKVSIGIDGQISLLGIDDDNVKERLQDKLNSKYTNNLRDKYLECADIPYEEASIALDYIETMNQLKKIKGFSSIEDVKVNSNGRIVNLPAEFSYLSEKIVGIQQYERSNNVQIKNITFELNF